MPVVGSDFRGSAERNSSLIEFAEGNVKECCDAAQEMDRVRAGENVKEAAGLVAGNVYTLRDKLAPG